MTQIVGGRGHYDAMRTQIDMIDLLPYTAQC